MLAVFLIPQTLFRLWYYGDIVPNTYYLKMTGFPFLLRIERGLRVAFEFVIRVGWMPFVLLLFRRDRQVRYLLWLFIGQVLYSIYVGADAWEDSVQPNRYIVIAMPLCFVLVGCALVEIQKRILNILPRINLQVNRRYVQYGMAVVAVLLLFVQNTVHGVGASTEWALQTAPSYTETHVLMVKRAEVVNTITTPQARIAVVWAGITPYFSDREMIDLLGKNDKTVAHLKMNREVFPDFYPGHMKWDYAYSIGQLKPDVVLGLWGATWESRPYLEAGYVEVTFPLFNLFLRKDSPFILWDQVSALDGKTTPILPKH
jgi:hypothetical protein